MDKITVIKNYFKRALEIFYKQDYENLDFEGSERAKVFRIAHYLADLVEKDSIFKGYTVDCEFNRLCFDRKKDLHYIKKIKGKEVEGDYIIIPDLIVHIRASKKDDYTKNNLLVCEFKNSRNCENDLLKVKEIIHKYHYKLGLVINLSKKEENLNDIKFIPLSAVQCEKWLLQTPMLQ